MLRGAKHEADPKDPYKLPQALSDLSFVSQEPGRWRLEAATVKCRVPKTRRSFMISTVSSHTHRGRFITFEGLDGCGKSTQLEKLAGVFRPQGLSVVVTREPGGTASGEKIRRLLLDTATAGLSPMAELALMFASRAQHIAEVIQPALAAGRIVLCDRFTDSTDAYQGGGRKLGSQPGLPLHHILCGDLQPDLTILMDSEVATSVERARRRNKKHSVGNGHGQSDENRFEQESRAFFGRVRSTYLAIAAREPQRVGRVDARGTAVETHATIVETARRKLKSAAKTLRYLLVQKASQIGGLSTWCRTL